MKPVTSRIALFVLQGCLVILAVGVIAAPVGAHAVLVSSSPNDGQVLSEPPKKVILRFNARIAKRVSQVTLRTAKGAKVRLPSGGTGYTSGPAEQLIVPMPKLKPGTYKLEYQIVATDGHVTPGLIRFTVSPGKSS